MPHKKAGALAFLFSASEGFRGQTLGKGRRAEGKPVSSELQREVNAASKQMQEKRLGTKRRIRKLNLQTQVPWASEQGQVQPLQESPECWRLGRTSRGHR